MDFASQNDSNVNGEYRYFDQHLYYIMYRCLGFCVCMYICMYNICVCIHLCMFFVSMCILDFFLI